MFYIPNIDDYLKILTDEEVKYFVPIDFSKYFKFSRKKIVNKVKNKILEKLLNCFISFSKNMMN